MTRLNEIKSQLRRLIEQAEREDLQDYRLIVNPTVRPPTVEIQRPKRAWWRFF